jgi:hypothetical protein
MSEIIKIAVAIILLVTAAGQAHRQNKPLHPVLIDIVIIVSTTLTATAFLVEELNKVIHP